MSKGYCKAYRNAWTHEAFSDLREAAIWNFLYQNAFWEDGQRIFNGKVFDLKRGQIVVSISFLSKGFSISERGARTVIQKLEKLQMLTTQTTNKATIITICNYNKFQSFEKTDDEQSENNPRANRQTNRDNNKEINKLNKLNRDDGSPKYKFFGKKIRLTETNYDEWKNRFSNLDGDKFENELRLADDYYDENPPKDNKWFFPVSRWMDKANKQNEKRREPVCL